MRPWPLLHKALHTRLLARRGSGWHALAVAGLLAAGGTLLLDQLFRAQAVPLSPAPRFAHLMKSMAAHSSAQDRTAPIDWTVRPSQKLKAGTPAPAFTLPALRGGGNIALADFKGRPLVLVFGSFTCDRFCARVSDLEQRYQAHKRRAEFLFVSVTEAEHRIPGLEFMLDPNGPHSSKALGDRRWRIAKAAAQLGFTMPAALDLEEAAETAYDAFPLRVVVVDAEGRLALDLGRGLFDDWRLDELEQWLKSHSVRAAGG
jgi:hypothetical protein